MLPLVQELECGVHALQEFATTQRERVRVSLPVGFAALLTRHLGRLHQEHPELTLETVSSARSMSLKRGEVDLALRMLPVVDENLIVRPLGEVACSLYASPTYLKQHPAPKDLDDLSGHDIIAYGSDIAQQPAARWIEKRANKGRIVMRANELDTSLMAAVDGAGLTILPCFLADQEPRLRRLTPEVLVTPPLSLVYRREARQSKAIKTAINFVVDVMRRNAARFAGTG
jgi:DNA-binding transcriptional LysR family regulator